LSYRKSNPISVGFNFFWEKSMVCSLEEFNLSFIKEARAPLIYFTIKIRLKIFFKIDQRQNSSIIESTENLFKVINDKRML